MKFIKFKLGKCFYIFCQAKIIFIFININCILFIGAGKNYYIEKKDIRVALCTMGKEENLYVNEFVEYYIKIGIDHIFIYDDNSREINYYKLDNQFNIIPQNENSDIIDNKENTNCLDTYFNKNNNKLYLVNFNSNNVYTIKEPLDRNREKTEFKKDGVIEHLYGFITERNNIIELFELNSEGVYIWNIYYNSEPDNIIKLNLSPIDMCLWNDDYLWLSSNKGFSLIEISKKENSINKDIKIHYGSKIRKIKTPLEDASIVGIDEDKKLCLWYNGKNKNN